MIWKVQTLGRCALAELLFGCVPVQPPAARASSTDLSALQAIRTIQTIVKVGDSKAKAVSALVSAGFVCRPLTDGDFGRLGPNHAEEWTCWTSTDRTDGGYTLAYGSLAADRQGRLIRVGTGSYPVIYRNLRKDAQGRTIVVQDPPLVRPVVAQDSLKGRWTIIAVNGRKVTGPWLELGGEGLGTVTTGGNAIFVASPQPRSRAYLGCNYWYPNGWTRNGDRLTLGREMSQRTEIGCDAATVALDDEAYAILSKAMTMEFTPPNGLRLINENGTVELVHNGR